MKLKMIFLQINFDKKCKFYKNLNIIIINLTNNINKKSKNFKSH